VPFDSSTFFFQERTGPADASPEPLLILALEKSQLMNVIMHFPTIDQSHPSKSNP
jgi:hypothetical protein